MYSSKNKYRFLRTETSEYMLKNNFLNDGEIAKLQILLYTNLSDEYIDKQYMDIVIEEEEEGKKEEDQADVKDCFYLLLHEFIETDSIYEFLKDMPASEMRSNFYT